MIKKYSNFRLNESLVSIVDNIEYLLPGDRINHVVLGWGTLDHISANGTVIHLRLDDDGSNRWFRVDNAFRNMYFVEEDIINPRKAAIKKENPIDYAKFEEELKKIDLEMARLHDVIDGKRNILRKATRDLEEYSYIFHRLGIERKKLVEEKNKKEQNRIREKNKDIDPFGEETWW